MLSGNSNIILVGFMGSGKSYWGKQLSQKLNYTFIDFDALIEETEGKTIRTIFEEHGEVYFRQLEAETVQTIQSDSKLVISTGGGTPCFNDNMTMLNTKGLSIYLKCEVETLFSRLIKEKQGRPLVKDKSEHELKEYIQKALYEREQFYRLSKIVIEEKDHNIDQVINLIENARIS